VRHARQERPPHLFSDVLYVLYLVSVCELQYCLAVDRTLVHVCTALALTARNLQANVVFVVSAIREAILYYLSLQNYKNKSQTS
jgi:hypothetical protein